MYIVGGWGTVVSEGGWGIVVFKTEALCVCVTLSRTASKKKISVPCFIMVNREISR